MAEVGNEIFEWVKSLPAWQRHLFAVSATDVPTFDETKPALDALILESGGKVDTPGTLQDVSEADFDEGSSTESLIAVTKLGQIKQVGAINERAELDFGSSGVSIVYGENAAGKSSYSRLLKYLGRSASPDGSILRNVYDSDPAEQQEATVQFQTPSGTFSETFNLSDQPPPSLAAMRAFDHRSAVAYVASKRTVDFTPTSLETFKRVANAQAELAELVKSEIDRLQDARAPFDGFHDGTRVKVALTELNAKTDPAELLELGKLSEKELARLEELRRNQALAALEETEKQAARFDAAANDADSLKTRVAKLVDLASDEAIQNLRALETTAAAKADAERIARTKAFADQPLDGIGSDSWRELWAAARKFDVEFKRDFPPTTSGLCPLCVQPIEASAGTRLAEFEAFVVSTVVQENRAAQLEVTGARDTMRANLEIAGQAERLARIKPEDQALHDQTEAFLDSAESRLVRILEEDGKPAQIESLPEDPTAGLTEFSTRFRTEAESIRRLANDKDLAVLKSELSELEDRLRLTQVEDDVRQFVSREATIERLVSIRKSLSTRAVSNKQSELASTVLDDQFKLVFQSTIDELGLSHLRCKPQHRADRGTTVISVELDGAVAEGQVQAVLSEGEQRALALCFFLAEARVAGAKSPLVLDDPVSSLDRDRRAAVANLIASIARDRQVIVFTHDPTFMYDLVESADAMDVHLHARQVYRLNREAGFVDEALPDQILKPKERLNALEGRVNRLPDPEAGIELYREAIHGWYVSLRKTWERAIEVSLLNGVVVRNSREVKTRSLGEVTVNDVHRDLVLKGMSRCSIFGHDQPASDSVDVPSKDEMREDLRALSDFLSLIEDERRLSKKNEKVEKKERPSITAARS